VEDDVAVKGDVEETPTGAIQATAGTVPRFHEKEKGQTAV
jgi:hypothetical protein